MADLRESERSGPGIVPLHTVEARQGNSAVASHAQHVSEDRNHPGPASARIMENGVHVWALVNYAEGLGHSEEGKLQKISEDYELPEETIIASFAYYRKHKDAIDVYRHEINSNDQE